MLVTQALVRPGEIVQAARLLEAGELVGLPTETVYGLAADADNPQAVAKIYTAKGRPSDHPVIVHLHRNADPLRWAAALPDVARKLIEAFWPGPLTLVLPRRPGVAEACAGGQDTIALRSPDHPVAQAVLALFKGGQGGLAAPSANRFGRISPTTAAHVRAELGDAVALVLDGGPCSVGVESTIVDCSRLGDTGLPRILRPGGLDAAEIAAVLGCRPALLQRGPAVGQAAELPDETGDGTGEGGVSGDGAAHAAPRVPGALASHYAPATRLRLRRAAAVDADWPTARRVAVLAPRAQPAANTEAVWFALPAEAAGYAHGLYAALRDLDAQGLAEIWAEIPPEGFAWDAVHDRLRRAAADS